MIDLIHKYFRDRVVGIMLTVSCIVIAVMSVGSFKLIAAITQDEDEWYFGTGNTYSVFSARMTEDAYALNINILEKIFEMDGNLLIQMPYSMQISNTMDQHSAMVMSSREQIEAQFPFREESREADACIYLGEDILDATYFVDNSRYINIGGAEFKVAGILKNTSLGSNDERMMIAYAALSKEAKKVVELHVRSTSELWIRMPEGQSSPVYTGIQEECKMLPSVYDAPRNFYSENANAYLLNILKPAVLIFCVVDLLIATFMWLRRQKEVIAVLKYNGASRDDLYLRLGRTYLKCFLPAVLAGLIVWWV